MTVNVKIVNGCEPPNLNIQPHPEEDKVYLLTTDALNFKVNEWKAADCNKPFTYTTVVSNPVI